MKIETAFLEEAIETAGTGLDLDESRELKMIIRRFYDQNDMGLTIQLEELMELFFVAGRTYQEDFGRINVSMSRSLVGEFMEFLARKGVPDD